MARRARRIQFPGREPASRRVEQLRIGRRVSSDNEHLAVAQQCRSMAKPFVKGARSEGPFSGGRIEQFGAAQTAVICKDPVDIAPPPPSVSQNHAVLKQGRRMFEPRYVEAAGLRPHTRLTISVSDPRS